MSIKTTTKFLEDVKRNVIMPPSQRLLTSADILSLASSIMESELVPLLLAARQGYLEATYSVPLVADVSTSLYGFSGDVELESKPSWAI